jgi:tRNA-uridine 2-sulfurtransferase
LLKKGYDIIGLTAAFKADSKLDNEPCEYETARNIAKDLDFPHYIIPAQEIFQRQVIDKFLLEYSRGRTPSPCVICNQLIKFGFLLDQAKKMNCSFVATGHYARLINDNDCVHLKKARDNKKDQSYFLHRLSPEQLSSCIFPLGNLHKPEIYELIKTHSISADYHSESQDLCFVNSPYAEMVEQKYPHLKKKGNILDIKGNILGTHNGFYHYTIGQRTAINIASATRKYVLNIDSKNNTITIGERSQSFRRLCKVEDINWIERISSSKINCSIRLRYRHKEAKAALKLLNKNSALCSFAEPQFAITPGQAAVFYKGNTLLGGGWIGSFAV